MLGCNYASADVDADQILYVGGGKRELAASGAVGVLAMVPLAFV